MLLILLVLIQFPEEFEGLVNCRVRLLVP